MSTDPTVQELLERNKYSLPIFASPLRHQLTPLAKTIRRHCLTATRPLRDPICWLDTTTHRHPSVYPAASSPPNHLLISPQVTCADPRCIPEQFLGLRPAGMSDFSSSSIEEFEIVNPLTAPRGCNTAQHVRTRGARAKRHTRPRPLHRLHRHHGDPPHRSRPSVSPSHLETPKPLTDHHFIRLRLPRLHRRTGPLGASDPTARR